MADEEDRAALVGDFKPGSIKQIKMHCFLTYEDVVVNPGPRLNMVVGPNGTGKSTILNAICLGLGGTPKLLGRADDARAFIMHGKQKAWIEIELAPLVDSDEVHIIRREIDKNKGSEKGRGKGASTFYINDEKVKDKDVQKLVSETYNISIDNLCTFLPQDKVGSFSGFDSKQMLLETEKTLKNGVYQTHLELIEDETKLESDAGDVSRIESKLKKLQHENERLEREKDRMEEREKALAQAELLNKKRLWLQYEALRDQALELRELKNQCKQEIKDAMAEKKPLEDRLNALTGQKKENDDRYKKLDQNTQRYQKEMAKQMKKYETHDESVETCMLGLQEMDTARAEMQKKLEAEQKKLENNEEKLAQLPEKSQLEDELKEKNDKKKEIHRTYKAAEKEARAAKTAVENLEDDFRRAQVKVKKNSDDGARRRERVFRQNANLRKAYNWLEQNRSKFRKSVYGPICCEVTPKSDNAAAYLEQHAPNWVLNAFVVETKEDYDALYQEIRIKQRTPINIVNVEGASLQESRVYSKSKMNVLKKDHGVLGYLDESFSAPRSVLVALQIQAMTHKVLVGTDKTQASINNKKLLDYLSEPDTSLGQSGAQACVIFASDGRKSYKYTQMVSRYSRKVTCRVDDVMGAKLLAQGVSERAKREAEDALNLAKEKLDEATPRTEELGAKMQKLQAELQNVDARAKAAAKGLKQYVDFETKVKSGRQKVKDKQLALEGDNNLEKKELVQKMMKAQLHSVVALEAHAAEHEKMMQSTIKSAGLKINTHRLADAERQARSALHDKEKEFKELEEKAKATQAEFVAVKKKVAAKQKEAKEQAPIEDEDGEPLPLKAELEELEVHTLHEVEAAFEEAEMKANGIDANPDVIRQYEQRKVQIEETQAELEALTSEKDGLRLQIKQKRQTWEATLKKSVEEVNTRFTNYMAEMGFTGEVALVTGGRKEGEDETDSRDFKNWGIEIRVSFREGTKAQVLSDRVQSGGERSVSTIIYLMALQDLMVCPFRCVDEINQGLDERNERLVFKRIVSNATIAPKSCPTDHAGQYWLITPKLLPNLTDMEEEGVSVLFVYNGPNNFKSPTDWNMDDILPATTSRKAKRAVADDGADDENSGNTIPRKPKAKKSRRSSN